jgi:hypothetical protein
MRPRIHSPKTRQPCSSSCPGGIKAIATKAALGDRRTKPVSVDRRNIDVASPLRPNPTGAILAIVNIRKEYQCAKADAAVRHTMLGQAAASEPLATADGHRGLNIIVGNLAARLQSV